MQKAIEVERNAKNQAYAFIVAAGLLANFSAFCQNVHCDNWHEAVVNLIASDITKN